ncbi:phosphoribosylformylglycinamidine cyclo-ligase [Hymenobacter sp. RP-2-7]|uniref:Phosphoribosylformylglycinamidine cyclo-ligase n=1 Tax=Hymenobacter polaris TaxID=2682546 RepID=A0A7Y0FND4_9BACT|nr:AIR synthase-related protein [Hymenobacter polaris]NML66793.1 phosphoribosylformylglycinamidine cyclo-ligase [Hymenobacter polaris]
MSASNTPDTGYSIEEGNNASRNAYAWAKKTFTTRAGLPGEPARGLDGGFSNEIRFGQERLGISSDGIGTKIELAERLDRYDTLGYDLVAMTADDLIAAGFVPTNLSNIIDVNTLSYSVVDELMRGLHDACQFSKIAITGGEIAELGSRIGGYPGARMNFNWASTAIGVLHPSLAQPLSGAAAQPGDAVVALQSPSFRSNGYSLARKTLQRLFGDKWHEQAYDGPDAAQYPTWGDALLAPSLIYSPAVAALLDAGQPLRGAAHITGGGVADNFQRVLQNGLGAELDNLFPPLPAMQRLCEIGGIEAETAYLYWNMGNGMLLVVAPEAADAVVQQLTALGYAAQVAGRLMAEAGVTLRVAAGELRYG